MKHVQRNPPRDDAAGGLSAAARRFVNDALLAVVVIYGESIDHSATVNTLGADLRGLGARLHLIVYDNSPTSAGVPPALQSAGEWDIHYIHDPTNPGVGAAYVEAARIAEATGRRWLLLLDEDTKFPLGALAAYAGAVIGGPAAPMVAPMLRAGQAIVSPCIYRWKRGRALPSIAPGLHEFGHLSVLNGGMCVELRAYREAGGHDPRIALDFSDHEFIGRFRRHFPSFLLVDVRCEHRLSAASSQTPAQRLRRFRFYCRGAMYMSAGAADFVFTFAFTLARAVLLTIRTRHFGFVSIAVAALFDHG